MVDHDIDLNFDFHGFSDRAREAMFPEKITAFAARAGLPQATVSKIMSAGGKAGPRLDIAAKMADALGVSLDWLVYGRGDGPGEDAIMKVPRYDATLAAGPGSWNEGRRRLEDVPFNADFIRKQLGRNSTKGLSIVEGRGDSMEPTITDGALLMVDEEDRRVIDGIFAFLLDGDARVKRFRKLTHGLMLLSDNPAYPPETVTAKDQAELQVIGRVVWVGQVL